MAGWIVLALMAGWAVGLIHAWFVTPVAVGKWQRRQLNR